MTNVQTNKDEKRHTSSSQVDVCRLISTKFRITIEDLRAIIAPH